MAPFLEVGDTSIGHIGEARWFSISFDLACGFFSVRDMTRKL